MVLLTSDVNECPTDNSLRYTDNKGNTPSLNILSPRGQMKANRGTSISSELIAVLLQRGEKLREAMVMSVDEDNDLDEPSGLASVIERFVA